MDDYIWAMGTFNFSRFVITAIAIFIALLFFFKLYSNTKPAEPSPTDVEVKEVVERFFASLEAQDTATLRSMFLDSTVFYAQFYRKDTSKIIKDTNENWLHSIARDSLDPVERIWDVRINSNDGVAQVWTSYDFHANGNFSHCGINAMTLIKAADGWKISSSAFTLRKQCEESPLGPLEQ